MVNALTLVIGPIIVVILAIVGKHRLVGILTVVRVPFEHPHLFLIQPHDFS